MPEAYEVGITLALQDGVSAGIQLIRRDLTLLDRAIAATSQNLSRLQAQDAESPNGSPIQPASPGAVTESEKHKPRETEATGADARSGLPSFPTVAKPQMLSMGLPGKSEDLQSPVAVTSVGSAAPQSRNVGAAGDTGAPEAAAQNGGVSWPGKLPDATTADRAIPSGPAAPKLPAKPQTVDPNGVASSQGRPLERLIGPTAPRFVKSEARAEPAGQVQGLDQPSRPLLADGRMKSGAPSDEPAGPALRQPLAERTTARDRQSAPVPSRSPPLGSQGRFEPYSPPSQRGTDEATAGGRSLTPSFSGRAAPEVLGGQPGVSAAVLDHAQAREPGLSSSAPPAQSSQSITLQGDIIIDGSRLGRWMTSSLARQASRPPSGPVGPDPRQTPLWSGQAQGF